MVILLVFLLELLGFGIGARRGRSADFGTVFCDFGGRGGVGLGRGGVGLHPMRDARSLYTRHSLVYITWPGGGLHGSLACLLGKCEQHTKAVLCVPGRDSTVQCHAVGGYDSYVYVKISAIICMWYELLPSMGSKSSFPADCRAFETLGRRQSGAPWHGFPVSMLVGLQQAGWSAELAGASPPDVSSARRHGESANAERASRALRAEHLQRMAPRGGPGRSPAAHQPDVSAPFALALLQQAPAGGRGR